MSREGAISGNRKAMKRRGGLPPVTVLEIVARDGGRHGRTRHCGPGEQRRREPGEHPQRPQREDDRRDREVDRQVHDRLPDGRQGCIHLLGTVADRVDRVVPLVPGAFRVRSLGLLVLLGEVAVTIAGFALVPLGFATRWSMLGQHPPESGDDEDVAP